MIDLEYIIGIDPRHAFISYNTDNPILNNLGHLDVVPKHLDEEGKCYTSFR